MRYRLWGILALLAVLAGCGSSAQKPPDRAPSALEEALRAIPASSGNVQFTDWATIKRYEKLEGVTGASSQAERMALVESATTTQAPFSMFASNSRHYETWGWDSSDLAWEALISTGGPPAYVLKFRPDFDWAPLIARFEERGFSKSTTLDVPVYSHPMDLSAEWIKDSEFAVLNTAIVAGQQLMVLSGSADSVSALLHVIAGSEPALLNAPGLSEMVAQYGEAASAYVVYGPDACALDAVPLAAGVQPALDGPAVQPYLAAIIGYRYEQAAPVGIISLNYLKAEEAQKDVEARSQRFNNGTSLATRQPYRDLMTLTQASANGPALTMRFSFEQSRVQTLQRMTVQRDLAFAACS